MKASILACLLIFSLSVSANIAPPELLNDELLGAWSYTVDTPEGVYKGKLVFEKNGDGYAGKMTSQAGETQLKNLEIDGNEVRFSLYVDGYLVKVKGAAEGDDFKGKVEVEYEYYTIKGKRVKEDALAGDWAFTANAPDGVTYKGKMVFENGANGYTGKMVIGENETALKNLKVEGNQVSFSLYAQGYMVKVKGTVAGAKLDAKGEVEYEYFPIKAEKVMK